MVARFKKTWPAWYLVKTSLVHWNALEVSSEVASTDLRQGLAQEAASRSQEFTESWNCFLEGGGTVLLVGHDSAMAFKPKIALTQTFQD